MITSNNFTALIQSIRPEELEKVLQGPKDFILLQAHIFNVGAFATIEEHDFCEDLQNEAHASGNLFCDKDQFFSLLEETQALEY